MTVPVLVRIFFHGIVALVPDDKGYNQMTALLVDARNPPPIASRCVVSHNPELIVLTKSAECTGVPGCTIKGPYCYCTPVRQAITLTADVQQAKKSFNVQPPRKIPNDTTSEAKEFSYAANLLNLPVTLDTTFVTGKPKMLLDRMIFSYDSIEPCKLSTRDRQSSGSDVYTFSLGRLGDVTGNTMSQAMAQLVVAQATVPYDVTTKKVTINLTNLDTGTPYSMNLIPETCDGAAGTMCINIFLSNARAGLPPGDPCDDGVGRDFAFFYELVTNPPAWEARLIPINDNGNKVDATILDISECAKNWKAPMNRPICALASFIK